MHANVLATTRAQDRAPGTRSCPAQCHDAMGPRPGRRPQQSGGAHLKRDPPASRFVRAPDHLGQTLSASNSTQNRANPPANATPAPSPPTSSGPPMTADTPQPGPPAETGERCHMRTRSPLGYGRGQPTLTEAKNHNCRAPPPTA